jgi:signal transduction histidine kinase
MLLAFAWWSFLLFTKNRDAFHAKASLNKIGMIANGLIETDKEFLETTIYKELESEYKKQEWMILGEAIVFVFILVIGVWFINQGYHKEIESAQQRRNFLLSITHELKSPIASIKLVLETFIKRELEQKHITKLSENALKETNRLNTLVNDLLLAAKVETTYEPHLEKINLAQFLDDIIDRLRQKHPDVQFDFRKTNNEIFLDFDKTGISSVAVNLLENAVKYSAESPIITTVLKEEEEAVYLEFADNGIGISNKDKTKVFERFYRVGNEDTRKTKGTGLGLYIVKQIILAHGGTIKIVDNQPKGSIFAISLPKNDG